MRVKRQKRFRKAVRFYKACFGFREPFKVLCDGNFQHFVHEQKLGEIPNLLSQALGGATKAFSTRCINAELKKLGKSFAGTLHAGKNLYVAKCNHEPLKPGSDCLESMVANNNPDHFFVATQDVDLRRKCRIMPGCALIFSKKTSLFVEPPSEFQQQFSRADEAQRERMSASEEKILEARESEESQGRDDPGESSQRVEEHRQDKVKKSLGIQDRPVFKRNRAKGPNPLSCKKKAKKASSAPKASQEKTSSRKRQRNRRKSARVSTSATTSSAEIASEV